ncbi:DNA translocase FtsK [Desulfitobacterium hafniense]|nr:DNA translocase FtsK [Desulfitobacterium hafniense]ACL20977.1 cell divisionFtsK/SpoIIIE [Desulfitobacterium hafniense DCB-2]EHL06957.1 putative stage III sporulation protein E [Desulfitobacterium hafniense DP7]KTE91249.1 cell division protein FtsK [Desulfitobacterium hafniense]MEA5023836.1 DNA translocase FtsK [Desulfitobacterium hafniense]CDX01863.1 DNA translocase FtsK [Desulfitobacterium hafniense]
MSKRKRKTLPVRQVVAIVLAILGFLALLGELGFTAVGKGLYNLMKYPLGEKVWLAPLVFFVLAIGVWVSALWGRKQGARPKGKQSYPRGKTREKVKRTNLQEERGEETFFPQGMELPKGKLVPLKGFKEYFSTDLEMKPMEPLTELDDLGRDFDTYFTEGKDISFKPIGTRLTTLQGFSSYFDEVSSEIEEEIRNIEPALPSKRQWEKPDITGLEPDRYPGQVAQLLKNERRMPQGISTEERAALLGKPLQTPAYNSEPSREEPWSEAAHKKENPKVLQEKMDLVRSIAPSLVKKESVKKIDFEPLAKAPAYEEATLSEASLLSEEEPIIREELISREEPRIQEDLVPQFEQKIEEQVPAINLEGNAVNFHGENEEDKAIEPKLKTTEALKKAKAWSLPSFALLDPLPQVTVVHDQDTQKHLEKVLEDFGVQAKVIRVARGPVITRYELAPAPGVKISRIVNLADDIALGLAARDVRIEAPIPGKSAIGIEVPNKHPRAVPFREVLETPEFKEGSAKLRIALGKDIGNQSIVANLAKMPHLLVAGATGSGKSVCITAIINSLLFNTRPDEVKFLMVDPKMVELSLYNGIPHLLAPVVTDPKKASAALKWVVKEMETRYELFAASGVRDIERYNQMKAAEAGQESGAKAEPLAPAMPWIVVIIDELADLMMVAADEVEEAICRLAQMARAAGIHLVIATQRPSVDVITGVIKANIPSRISFAVSSQIDSRTILDSTGAEKLLGRGDMLYSPQGMNKPMRVQGCMVADDEVQKVITHWKSQGSPEYLDPEGFLNAGSSGKSEGVGPDDELFMEAGHLIITTGMASVSYLQRKLKLGYARAARLIDLLEEHGVVGGYEGSKPRQILLTMDEFEERFG